MLLRSQNEGIGIMATQAEPQAASNRPRKKPASPFGGSIPIGVIGLVATIIGFLPTFFSRLAKVDAIHLTHGWTMTGWIVLVLVQATLIRSRLYKYHRFLGWCSLALFAAMVITSCQVLVLMLSGKSGLPFEAAKFFGYSDIVDMPLLLFSFGAAIYWRKDRHMHSRLMAVTVLTSIVPALARMFNILVWRSFEGLYHAVRPEDRPPELASAAGIWLVQPGLCHAMADDERSLVRCLDPLSGKSGLTIAENHGAPADGPGI